MTRDDRRETMDDEGPVGPIPEPLRGEQVGSFAHLTVTQRLPNILKEVLAVNDFPASPHARLVDLLTEIPAAPVRPIFDPGAPDEADWEEYVSPHLGQDWLQIPWFFAETYFYRRILEATGYFQPGPLQSFDPFTSQKQAVLANAGVILETIGTQVDDLLRDAHSDPGSIESGLKRLLVLNLWGNQSDLSMWSLGDDGRPDHQDLQQQESNLVVNASEAVVEHLSGVADRRPSVDFIMDNAGPELLYDLALADYLLSTELAGRVRFHLKFHPTFVSDAMVKDVDETLAYLASRALPGLRDLARRLAEYRQSGHFSLHADRFWNSPLPMWEMPARVREELQVADLLVNKGDANYRRLLGDRHWPFTTPFAQIVRYLPAPVLALRVAKAEVAVGLDPGQPELLDEQDPDWMVDGKWGMIQFSR